MDRRRFIGSGGAFVAAVTVGRHLARAAGSPFTLGVASGDPLPDGFVLWTRLASDPLAADGQGGMAGYTAAKSAVLGLTRSLARDYGKDNIRVNAIAPGWIMTQRQLEKWMTPAGEIELMQRQCLKRRLMPDEVARFTVFLASEEASACTNQHYVVDGGWV